MKGCGSTWMNFYLSSKLMKEVTPRFKVHTLWSVSSHGSRRSSYLLYFKQGGRRIEFDTKKWSAFALSSFTDVFFSQTSLLTWVSFSNGLIWHCLSLFINDELRSFEDLLLLQLLLSIIDDVSESYSMSGLVVSSSSKWSIECCSWVESDL